MTLAERARSAWFGASARERTLVVIGAVVVAGALLHALAWEPLTRDTASTARALEQARALVARYAQAANEIAGLNREVKSPRTADLRSAAERAVGAAGLRGELTAIGVDQGRVRLTFAAIDLTSFSALLELLGREEQLFAVEALLAARVTPGSIRAEVTLARPAPR